MTAYLVCEDGPHAGQLISLLDGDEWIIGRDPDVSFQVLEDPMVSRKHVVIRKEDGIYFLENLSTINPTLVNDDSVEGPYQLKEDDVVQIGNNYFRFTNHPPVETTHDESTEKQEELDEEIKGDYVQQDDDESEETHSILSEEPSLSRLTFSDDVDERWMIKVISGPNQGAEIGMDTDHSYIIGKDPETCDIIFQDLSVSKRHAKIFPDQEGNWTVEDLDSRNGVMLRGKLLEHPMNLQSGDSITLGTTTFLFIDRETSRETIYSPPSFHYKDPSTESDEELIQAASEEESTEDREKTWKETFIPTKHLVVASIFSLLVFVGFVSLLALFRSQSVMAYHQDNVSEIKEVIHNYKDIQFTYSEGTGKIFLVGHVLTDIDHSELLYLVNSLPFIKSVEDNVVVDEGVWESMNAMLSKNPNWRSIMVTSTKPGHFVLKGYLESEEEADQLQDYINLNFPYLNLLENQVVVENTLYTQVQSLLMEKGFVNVTFQFNNGEFIFAGRVNEKEQGSFDDTLDEIGEIDGVRSIKNFVIFTGASTARINISDKYQVNGTSKFGPTNQFVLINGKILGMGETLDGMTITEITSDEVLLDRDGLKYKIDYNQQ